MRNTPPLFQKDAKQGGGIFTNRCFLVIFLETLFSVDLVDLGERVGAEILGDARINSDFLLNLAYDGLFRALPGLQKTCDQPVPVLGPSVAPH